MAKVHCDQMHWSSILASMCSQTDKTNQRLGKVPHTALLAPLVSLNSFPAKTITKFKHITLQALSARSECRHNPVYKRPHHVFRSTVHAAAVWLCRRRVAGTLTKTDCRPNQLNKRINWNIKTTEPKEPTELVEATDPTELTRTRGTNGTKRTSRTISTNGSHGTY